MGVDDPVRVEGGLPAGAQVHHAHMLGNYRLIARLAQGGMGVLYLAVFRGPGGFHKLVAVKELLRDFSAEEALVAMFMDEARLAARLNHPNIVQTMEVGSTGGRHFMAMEYLEGQSLQRLVQRAQERGTPVPLGMHLGITLDLLAALDYAHNLADFDGTPLGVVHRDVTPHNVLVTYEGQIKLVDFGIAKTHEGVDGGAQMEGLKGKTRYMSPEQAACGPIDPRADLFSVGIMLWEAVVGRRPWDGRADADVLQSLAKGAVPRLREARPDIDPELAAVVDRAMSPEPEGRYPSALAMRDDLERYMVARSMSPLPTRALGALISRLFAEDRQRVRELIDLQLRALEAEGQRRDSSLPPTQMGMAVSVPVPGSDPPARQDAVEAEYGANEGPASFDPGASPASDVRALMRARSQRTPEPPPLAVDWVAEPSAPLHFRTSELLAPRSAPRRSTRGWLVVGGAGVGALVALAAFAVGRSYTPEPPRAAVVAAPPPAVEPRSPAPRPAHVVVRASPASARIYLDDQAVGNPYIADHVRDGTSHGLRIEAPGYETKASTLAFGADVDVSVDLGVAEAPPVTRSRAAAPQRQAAPAVPPSGRPPVPDGRATLIGPKPIETGNPYGP